ncbi:MAG: tetratricopeptide repeat protein [Chitinispirillia bacterium]|nr:tetratricopeptide repeat protein [Chitinispirillia bacterium]
MKRSLRLSSVLAVLVLSSGLFAQSPESLMMQGNEMMQRGAFDQAVTHFQRLVQMQPNNFEAQYNLALAYLGWGRHSQAIDNFLKATRLRPNSSHAWSNLAVAYQNMGRTNDAVNALNRAVRADPSNVTARINLASMYAATGKNNQAIQEYLAIVNGGHRESGVLLNLAKCLITANRIEDAKKYLRDAIAADPNNVEARYELADIFWRLEKDPAKAINELNLAISVRPDVGGLYDQLAVIYESEGKKKEAVEQLKKALIFTTSMVDKERLQARIDRLEGRNVQQTAPSGPARQMQQMKRDEPAAATRRTTTPVQPVNVDFGSLLGDENDDTPKSSDPMGDMMKRR